jgi:hypothetical protein
MKRFLTELDTADWFLLVGTAAIALGVDVVFGIGWALIVGGTIVLALGVLAVLPASPKKKGG